MDEKNVNNNLENANNNAQDLNVEPTNTENPYYNPYFQENGENNQNPEQPQGINQILAGGLEQPQAEGATVEPTTENTINPFEMDNNQEMNNASNGMVNNQILNNNNYQENMQNNFDGNYQNQDNFNMNYQNPAQDNFNMNYQESAQNNFDMNYQNPAQNNFDMNYQNQGQNNFDMNYQNPVQDNNMNYQNTIPNNQTQNNNTKKKNGKSVPIILIVIILLVIVGAIIAGIIFIPKMISKGTKPQNNLIDENIIDEPTTNFVYHNFYKDYGFDYDAAKWGEDSENKVITCGVYQLKFAQALENLSSVGYDIKMPTDRASFFTFLYNQFSAQADVSTTAVELGTSNFTLKDNTYYAYLDLVYGSSIERCYFILLPEDNMFVEFILSNEDTVISDEMNEEVLGYICNIYNQNEENNDFNGFTPIGNETLNNVSIENTTINETVTNEPANNALTTPTATDSNTSVGAPTGGIVLTRP